MIVNGIELLKALPIKAMYTGKNTGPGGTSYGLSEAGYDIRIKQQITFVANSQGKGPHLVVVAPEDVGEGSYWGKAGRFALASAMEEFQMPDNLTGIVHDKSTWARKGLSVFNTVIEPGWNGFLTLELVFHGNENLIIPAGAGIAQVIFHENAVRTRYTGKYQNQEDKPVSAIDSK